MAYSPDDPNLLAPPSLRRPGLVPMPQAPTLLQPPPATLHRLAPPPTPQDDDAWTQARAAQEYEANQQAARQNFARSSPFLSGLASGWEGLKGGYHGLVGAAEGTLGFEDAARKQLQAKAANQAVQADYDTGSPASLHDIHGVGDAFTWAEHELGAAIPRIAATVIPALLTDGGSLAAEGLLGGAALRGAAAGIGERAVAAEAGRLGLGEAATAAEQAAIRQAAARNVAQRAGATIAEDAAPETVEGLGADAVAEKALPRLKALAKARRPEPTALGQELRRMPGAVAGGAVVSGEGATQGLDPNMTDDQLRAASGKALVGAGAEGALMAIPGLALMNRYGVGEAAKAALAKKLSAPLWKRLIREGGEQAAIGGAVAPATAAANRVVHNWITGQGLTDGLVSPEALSDYLNSAAGGAVAGFALGAPAGMRAGDIKLPALSTRNRAFRIFQRLGKSQKDAAKEDAKPAPGSEIPLEDSPADTGTLFHSKLDKLQRARSQWEQDTFGDVKPLDVNEDHASALTVGTTNNVLGAKLFDPAQFADARRFYPGNDNLINASMASLLPPETLLADSTDAAVRATAKAVRHGFKSLNKTEQTSVGRFLNLLPPDKLQTAKQVISTFGILNEGDSGRMTLAPPSERDIRARGLTEADAASIGANDEGRAAIGTEGGEGTSGFENKLRETDTPTGDPISQVSDAVWKRALMPQNAQVREGLIKPEENIAVTTTDKNGKQTKQLLNIQHLAGAVADSPEGAAMMRSAELHGQNRRVSALTAALAEAKLRGAEVDPSSITAGKRVFPGENGKLTNDDINAVAQGFKARPQRELSTPQQPSARPQQDVETQKRAARSQLMGTKAQADAAVESAKANLAAAKAAHAAAPTPKTAQAVREAVQAVRDAGAYRIRVREQRATRNEAPHEILPAKDERRELTGKGENNRMVEGDTNQPFVPTKNPPVGTGETMVMHGKDGASRTASLERKLRTNVDENDRQKLAHEAAIKRAEGFYARLRAQLKPDYLDARDAGDTAAMHSIERRMAGAKKAVDQAKEMSAQRETDFQARQDKIRQQMKAAVEQGDVTVQNRGAGASEIAGRGSKEYEATLRDVEQLATKLHLVAENPKRGSKEANAPRRPIDSPERLSSLYRQAKEHPNRESRTGLLASIRRLADGDERLTAKLDEIDGIKGKPRANDTEAQRNLLAQADELDKRAAGAKGKRAKELRSKAEALRAQARAGANVHEGLEQAAIEKAVEVPKKGTKPAEHFERVVQSPKSEDPSLEYSKLETGDSLDRVSGDARSVADTVAAAKKNPAYKALFKALGDVSKGKQKPETLRKNLQGIVDRLSEAFGVSAPEVRLFDRSTTIEHQGEQVSLSDNLGALQRQRGLPSLMHIRSDLKTHEAVSTVLHEFGHHLQHELFDKLADLDPSRLAIMKDFKRWRSQIGSDATTRDVRSSRAPFFGTLADVRLGGEERMLRDMDPGEAAKYLTSFPEYFADMTARALTGHEGVQGIVGEFFAKVAHAMRLVYDLLAGNDRKFAEAPQSFKDFVSRTWRGAPEQSPEAANAARFEAASNIARMPRSEALAAAAEASSNGGTTPPRGTPPHDGASPGGAGGAPSDITLGMNSRDRGLIEKVITRRDVFEKILKEFPQLRDRLLNYSTQMETAINAAYALWKAGKLQLSGDKSGTGYAGAFRRFDEQVMNVFGLKSTRQLGERIFKELAAGTYDMKDNVRVKQRRDYLNSLADRAKTAEGVEAAALKGRIALRRSINYALHINENVVRPLVDRALRGLDERLRATNNTDLRKFVSAVNRMTGEIGGQEGYVNQIHRITNKRANELSTMVDNAKLSKEDEALVMKHLMLGGDVPNRPELTALRNKIYDFTSLLERSHKQGGSFGHITGGFFPYRFDHAAARANKAEVHSIMSEIGGAADKDKKLEQGARDYFAAHWAKQHASDFLQTPEARSSLKGRRKAMTALNAAAKEYADGLNVEALRERMADIMLRDPAAHFRASLQDDPFMGSRKPGGGPSLNPRAFGLFDKAGRHDLLERLQKFQSPGIVDTMLPYLHAMVKRQTFYDNFVKERATAESKHLPVTQQVQEQYNLLDDHLAAARDSGATDKELQLARDYMDAQLGLYGDPNGHPLIQKMFQAVDKQLGTKMGAEDSRTWERISNAVTTYQNLRVLGLGILGNMIDPLGNWTRGSSFSTAFAGYREAARAAFKKSDASYLRAHAEALGVAERHALSEGLSWAFNAAGSPGTTSYKINQLLFKYNGMHMMTNFARIAALASAHKFLLEHAQLKGPHSQRYLDELGLKASDIKPDAQHPGYVDATNEKVQKALFQFVDESVVRPHAGQRPLWHSDPGFKMMSQYRGFIFSFYDTIMKRMMHEVKHGNLGGVAPLVGYVGVTMAAELAREMVQYGPAGNPNRADWGAADWVVYSLERSGALGPRADFMNSAYPELANSRVPIPYESLTGPTVSQVDDLVDMAIGQRSTGSTTLQSLPGESIYHGWVHRGPAKDTHQSAGQVAANFADDFVLE